MIGNKYLEKLFNYPDRDTSINELLELLKYKDLNFIYSLKKEDINLDLCTDDEIRYLTKVSSLIDYCFQIHGLEIPSPFRRRNTYFDLDSIVRV